MNQHLFIQRLGITHTSPAHAKAGSLAQMRLLAEQVCEDHGLSLRYMLSPERCRSVAWPRQEAMARIYATGRYSLPTIGRFFNRHHTTVLHAIRAHAKRLAEARASA